MTTTETPVPIPAEKDDDLRLLIDKVNGFVYYGDRLDAVLDTIRALRADLPLAKRLLDLP